ncbi:Uncharacterised protein [Mycobacterium tuberculosis]|nr:Uncharacterised protein [Mycobacterium tuberculosis]
MADHDDVAGEVVVVEITHAQVGEHRHVPVQDVVASFAAGQRHVELAVMPPFVDGVESGDGLVVVAVFQLADLRLVDADDLVGGNAECGADDGGRLRRPDGHGVREQCRPPEPLGERQRLITAQRGQRRARRPGVQPAFDVAV